MHNVQKCVTFIISYGEEFPVLEYSDLSNAPSLTDEYENFGVAAFAWILGYWRCSMSIVGSVFSCCC